MTHDSPASDFDFVKAVILDAGEIARRYYGRVKGYRGGVQTEVRPVVAP